MRYEERTAKKKALALAGTITTLIAFIARSPAPRRLNARAHPHLLLLRLITTLGGSIAAVCSRHRLPLDCDFATHRLKPLR